MKYSGRIILSTQNDDLWKSNATNITNSNSKSPYAGIDILLKSDYEGLAALQTLSEYTNAWNWWVEELMAKKYIEMHRTLSCA